VNWINIAGDDVGWWAKHRYKLEKTTLVAAAKLRRGMRRGMIARKTMK
jgi:hypothetical protein